jgi:uncharacterized protein YciI
MTPSEKALMQEHVMYWKGLADKGTTVVFGPVADPNGAWGVAIVEVDDEPGVHALTANDPTIKANLNFRFEIYPMPNAILRKQA